MLDDILSDDQLNASEEELFSILAKLYDDMKDHRTLVNKLAELTRHIRFLLMKQEAFQQNVNSEFDQNNDFETLDNDIIDFTESNPFGSVGSTTDTTI